MRLRHAGGRTVHLGYCTNVHPAEDLAGILAQLDRYAVPVRSALGTDLLGLGLWLAAPVAAELAADANTRRRLRTELTVRGLEVVTLNGFPYAAFQAPVVKGAVYQPDWTTAGRLGYTLDLARVLADLLPDDAERGSVSTLPLAWRTPWDAPRADAARRRLDQLAAGLAAVERDTGRPVRVGFEPEPGCVVESTGQAVAALSGMDAERLGICLDLAHLACAWEDPAAALDRLAAAGLPVVKVQVSAALEAADPVGDAAALRRWVEPRFLHQTRAAGCAAATDPTGPLAAVATGGPADPAWAADDLDAALDAALPGPWRVHYHVPLHAPPEPPLGSTLPVLRAALAALFTGTDVGCDHLDVETYTWGVLPADRRPRTDAELAVGIAAELAFTRDELVALGLTPTGTAVPA
ncbi:Xylose isomerase-like TIM barrel [Micromonospora phaseoli]|uniref:Xylose isomerase-like TIM barrel n=1 Tax=Micromonospora phaseoli TaxID=1144548 RepID=A0A1H7CEW2_9ACTN|nr:metabolite traffic protein EboE [Micromonospora phaseoli]PZV97856.1 xylose isomerase-like TIM barrel protein [Micromonospora phaseoli]GIJ78408.1 xylose isomerase [Micromonospora phaseoli]SEJ88241.1 Xylose isomerase-like TIM barrel [Micromonospora phaseoli]